MCFKTRIRRGRIRKTNPGRGDSVNQSILKGRGRFFFIAAAVLLLGAAAAPSAQEHQVQKAKIYEEIYPLLGEGDLYCSFLIDEDPKPELSIVGAEREYERDILSDGDVVYLNQGRDDGLEVGQLFIVYESGKNIPGFGTIVFKRGRVRVEALVAHQASAVIEKSCGWIRKGDFLRPFEPLEPVMGKDLGYDIPPFEVEGSKGEVIFLDTEFNQIGSQQWALVSMGQQAGLQVGQQLIIYRIVREGAPVQIFGNSVVIDVQSETATIKMLSCRDAVRIGDLVMFHPTR